MLNVKGCVGFQNAARKLKKNITDVNNFYSAQLVQLPRLSNRERAIRIHLGFMDEPFVVGIS